jgi:hypothetical protein
MMITILSAEFQNYNQHLNKINNNNIIIVIVTIMIIIIILPRMRNSCLIFIDFINSEINFIDPAKS